MGEATPTVLGKSNESEMRKFRSLCSLVQVNSDRSKNLNKVFLKAYFASKLIQSDINFSNQ